MEQTKNIKKERQLFEIISNIHWAKRAFTYDVFLEELRTPKSTFEINQPLGSLTVKLWFMNKVTKGLFHGILKQCIF